MKNNPAKNNPSEYSQSERGSGNGKYPSDKEIRSALERELEPIRLSPRMKRDILYSAGRSKKVSEDRRSFRYLWAAAAVVVLLCASVLATGGGRVFPDASRGQPLAQNTAAVAASGNTQGTGTLPASGDAEPTLTPVSARSTPEPVKASENVVHDIGTTPEPTAMPDVVYAVSTPAPVPVNAQSAPEPVNESEDAVYAACEPTEAPVNVVYDIETTPEPTAIPDVVYDVSTMPWIPESARYTLEPTAGPEVVYDVSDGPSYYGAEDETFYHTDEHCSGMENSVLLGDLSGRQPCPVCAPENVVYDIGTTPEPTAIPDVVYDIETTPEPTAIPDVVYDITASPESAGAEQSTAIGLTRYIVEDGCVMELEYAADQEFRYIYDPDINGWYAENVNAEGFSFGEYFDHRLPDENIAMVESTYAEDGAAGFEVREVIVMLSGVNTEFSSDSGDVPSGSEYRFDDTGDPSGACVLYVLDEAYAGDTAEVTVVERRQQWWFDGEGLYRQTVPDSTVHYTVNVEIEDGGAAEQSDLPTDNANAEVRAFTLGENEYILAEYLTGDYDLTGSALIGSDGSTLEADMTADTTFHESNFIGWRYARNGTEDVVLVRVADGEQTSDIPLTSGKSLALTVAQLAQLLSDSGVAEEDIDSAVASLILLGENGDIAAVVSSPAQVRDELLEAGLTDDEITAGSMVDNVLAILDDGYDDDVIIGE